MGSRFEQERPICGSCDWTKISSVIFSNTLYTLILITWRWESCRSGSSTQKLYLFSDIRDWTHLTPRADAFARVCRLFFGEPNINWRLLARSGWQYCYNCEQNLWKKDCIQCRISLCKENTCVQIGNNTGFTNAWLRSKSYPFTLRFYVPVSDQGLRILQVNILNNYQVSCMDQNHQVVHIMSGYLGNMTYEESR